MTPTIIPTSILSLTPTISVTATPTLLPTIVASPTIAPISQAASSLSTLFWAVLILLGGAILGIFGFLMGQGSKKEN